MTAWLICRYCMTAVAPGTEVCKCVQGPGLPHTQTLMMLVLPDGYEIVRKAETPAFATVEDQVAHNRMESERGKMQ